MMTGLPTSQAGRVGLDSADLALGFLSVVFRFQVLGFSSSRRTEIWVQVLFLTII